MCARRGGGEACLDARVDARVDACLNFATKLLEKYTIYRGDESVGQKMKDARKSLT